MRMQSAYRKQRELREERDMAAVFQPFATRMFKGHRNGRTMV